MFYVYHVKLPDMGLDQGYVGITNNPIRRWSAHTTAHNHNNLFKNNLKKYKDKVVRVILAVFDTREDALWLEFTLRPTPNIGWNIQTGGGPSSVMSEDTRTKISNALKGRKVSYMTEEGKASQREKMLGRKASSETKSKLSAQRQGRNNNAARPVNIYLFEDNTLVAKDVLMSDFCKDHDLHKGHLCSTAKGKLKQHKGFYARYL